MVFREIACLCGVVIGEKVVRKIFLEGKEKITKGSIKVLEIEVTEITGYFSSEKEVVV